MAYHVKVDPPTNQMFCTQCGAVIEEELQRKHDEFHQRIDNISAEAQRYKAPPTYG